MSCFCLSRNAFPSGRRLRAFGNSCFSRSSGSSRFVQYAARSGAGTAFGPVRCGAAGASRGGRDEPENRARSLDERLRGHLAAAARVERIVDFGHAPIFPDADVFPCIVLLRRHGEHDPAADEAAQAMVCSIPRNVAETGELGAFVAEQAFAVPAVRFTSAPWSLEPPEVERLMEKIR